MKSFSVYTFGYKGKMPVLANPDTRFALTVVLGNKEAMSTFSVYLTGSRQGNAWCLRFARCVRWDGNHDDVIIFARVFFFFLRGTWRWRGYAWLAVWGSEWKTENLRLNICESDDEQIFVLAP
jgi:hypothetical protein